MKKLIYLVVLAHILSANTCTSNLQKDRITVENKLGKDIYCYPLNLKTDAYGVTFKKKRVFFLDHIM